MLSLAKLGRGSEGYYLDAVAKGAEDDYVGRGDRVVPTSYLDAGHLDHGYAMTIHKAQGLTADETLVLATDDLYKEAGYTALGRARLDSRVYVVADDFDADPSIDLSHAARDRRGHSLDSDLARSLNRSRSTQRALDR